MTDNASMTTIGNWCMYEKNQDFRIQLYGMYQTQKLE